MNYSSKFQKRINELFHRHEYRMAADGERMTRQDYADRVGTTVNSLRGWLRGSGQPDAEGLARIAEVERVTVDWLVGRTSEPDEASDDPQRARLIQRIREADFETLAKLEQFANFLEYQKEQAAAPDRNTSSRKSS